MIKNERLLSLDAFRGFTIAAMILVNTPGSWSYVYPPFAHANWHGCSPTDLVFPFFLFIVGVSMWFSFKQSNFVLNQAVLLKIAKRVGLIFLIGLLLNAFPFFNTDWSQLRVLGVLQRIAIAFGLASLICLSLKSTRNILIFSALVLIGYWYMLYIYGGTDPYGLKTNVVRQLDLKLLGASHLWQGKGIAFDPEGLLSSVPASISIVFGFLFGKMISNIDRMKLLFYAMIAGVVTIIIGQLWGMVFPINKALWTSSYVLYTTGIAYLFFAFFIWLIDYKKKQKWITPLLVYGKNSLFAYILSIAWVKILFTVQWGNDNLYNGLFKSVFSPLFGNMNGSLLFAIFHILFFGVLLNILYQKRIFIKV